MRGRGGGGQKKESGSPLLKTSEIIKGKKKEEKPKKTKEKMPYLKNSKSEVEINDNLRFSRTKGLNCRDCFNIIFIINKFNNKLTIIISNTFMLVY